MITIRFANEHTNRDFREASSFSVIVSPPDKTFMIRWSHLPGRIALRKAATVKIEKAVAKLGATVVLIQTDDFVPTPINNVNLVGVAYE